MAKLWLSVKEQSIVSSCRAACVSGREQLDKR